MAELNLSNALLDGTILTHTIHPDDEDYDNHELTKPEYPALVYSDPYKALNQTILFKPPSKKLTKTVLDTDQSIAASPPRCIIQEKPSKPLRTKRMSVPLEPKKCDN